MLINDFYKSKIVNYTYTNGKCEKISDLFEKFILPKLPKKYIIESWHKLIIQYINSDNAIYFIRKYESTKRNGKWNTRRGCVVKFDNLEFVYSSNFLAHDIYLMALNDFCPSFDDFKNMIENRKLRNTIGTSFERKYSLYPGNNKTLKCYLAHIIAVNKDAFLRSNGNFSKLSKKEKNKLFPIGNETKWDNPKKIYRIYEKLNDEEKDIIKAHTVRLLDPINYFLTPQTYNTTHNISGFNSNIGEFSPLIEYVINEYKKIYGNVFDEFIINSKFKLKNNLSNNEIINLEYDSTWYVLKTKGNTRKYNEDITLKVAKHFLENRDGLVKIEKDLLGLTNKKGWVCKKILDSLGILNIKKGILIDKKIDEEILIANDIYKETLTKIKNMK